MGDKDDETATVIEVLKPFDDGAHDAVLKSVETWIEDRRKDREEGVPPLAALAIIVVYSDGSMGSMYDGGNRHFTLLGAITALQNEMAHR